MAISIYYKRFQYYNKTKILVFQEGIFGNYKKIRITGARDKSIKMLFIVK